MKVFAKKVLYAYLASVVLLFVAAVVVRDTVSLALGQKVWDAAVCVLIIPFQLLAAIIAAFSPSGHIDTQALNNVAVWVFLIWLTYFVGSNIIKRFRGGGAAH